MPIDFLPTLEQRQIVDSVGRFLADRLPPEEVRRRDRKHVPPYDLLPEMARLGLFRLGVPAEHGGLGDSWISVALVQERLGYGAYMAASIFNRVIGFGVQSLLVYGTEAQRRSLLPLLLEGRALIVLALSEPEAGSDAAAVRTRAERVPGGWRLFGRKTWISDADGATHLITLARTPNDGGSDGDLTTFLVPRSAANLSMTALPKVGNNAMPCWDIGFDGVRVGDEDVMGELGRGLSNVLSTLHFSRASMAATVTGCAQAAVDLALAHARERRQFGRPIGSFQALRHRLADMQMRVDQSHLTMLHLAWLIATGAPARRQASQAKIIATEALHFVTDAGMQIMASAGYAADSDMQRFWRDARLYTFGEGTNEIQRDLVARDLGL